MNRDSKGRFTKNKESELIQRMFNNIKGREINVEDKRTKKSFEIKTASDVLTGKNVDVEKHEHEVGKKVYCGTGANKEKNKVYLENTDGYGASFNTFCLTKNNLIVVFPQIKETPCENIRTMYYFNVFKPEGKVKVTLYLKSESVNLGMWTVTDYTITEDSYHINLAKKQDYHG